MQQAQPGDTKNDFAPMPGYFRVEVCPRWNPSGILLPDGNEWSDHIVQTLEQPARFFVASKFGRTFFEGNIGYIHESIIYAEWKLVQWTDEEGYPCSDWSLVPMPGGVICQLLDDPEKTSGGIYLTERTKRTEKFKGVYRPQKALVLESLNPHVLEGSEVLIKPDEGLRMTHADAGFIPEGITAVLFKYRDINEVSDDIFGVVE